MHVDSDEEAAAIPTTTTVELRNSPSPTPVVMSNRSLGSITAKLQDLRRELLTFDDTVPSIVSFCVDNKLFSVHRDVLLKDPQSVLFLKTVEQFRHGTKEKEEENVIEIPGRDAILFGMLMNLLRGYKNPIPEAYREACFAEARYYGLENSWGSCYHTAVSGPFRPLMCTNKLFSDLVCAAASPFFSHGLHFIRFGVTRCEVVGVGVVAESASLSGIESVVHSEGLALYWNDERVTHNFGRVLTEKTGCSFTANAVIRVELDCEENTVRWMLSNDQCVAIVRLPPNTSFAFAAVLVRSSEVQIISSE